MPQRAADAAAATPAPADGTAPEVSTPGAAAAPAPVLPPIPERAAADYARALQLMKSGNPTDAELEFKQVALAYPEYSGPEVNLGLIYLRTSRLPEAESAFRAALTRNPDNAIAGNELGIVLRKLGKFVEAEAAYQKAIAARADYASAHLNLGILYDLYLDEPQKALDQYQQYLSIAGDNKQVSGWMIELRKRAGLPRRDAVTGSEQGASMNTHRTSLKLATLMLSVAPWLVAAPRAEAQELPKTEELPKAPASPASAFQG